MRHKKYKNEEIKWIRYKAYMKEYKIKNIQIHMKHEMKYGTYETYMKEEIK